MKDLWNKFTDNFGNTIFHPQFIMLSYTKEALTEIRKYSKDKKIIDLGSGRAPYKNILEKNCKSYVNVDHPKISKFYKTENKPKILADISKNIPVKEKSFDIAIMLEVLEYLENPAKTFAEINRILKPKGVLILTSPFLYSLHDIPYDRNRFTDTQIKTLLKNSGFKIKKIKANGNFLSFWFQSLNVFLMKRVLEILKSKRNFTSTLYLFFLVPITPIIILSTNIIFALTRNTKINLTNYFVLDYLVVATKQ